MKLTTYFGKPVEGSYQRYLDGIKDPVQGNTIPGPSNIQNVSSYLILPGRRHGSYEYPDLLVSTIRTHHGENWNQAHKSLKQEDSFMLTIRQYVDFLNLLKSGNVYDGDGKKVDKSTLDGILDDITKVKSFVRAEWLDAKFSSQVMLRKNWHIIYHNQQSNEINEPLEECLMSDKTPGIDLSYWLINATSQGLPTSNNLDGSLYYWFPRKGAVARFYANSDRADLDCNRDPQNSDSVLGVRAAKIKV